MSDPMASTVTPESTGDSVGPATCWICGGPGISREHKTKRSDLRDVFGKPTQAAPIFFHDAKRRNRRVGSLNADILKSSGGPCADCNNRRTQPHDRAWERMSHALRVRHPPVRPGDVVRADRIFPHDTARQMLCVQLYFVKVFGCHIVEGGISIDLASLGRAIMNEKAHPNVYLKFGRGPSFAGEPTIGMSDVWAATDEATGRCAFATWFYSVSGISVNVMFAVEGEARQGLVGAWHPRLGSNRLTIADFSGSSDEASPSSTPP